jgi:hypothetical protein
MTIDDAGVRIDGPVAYHATFSEIASLDFGNEVGCFFIAIRSSPPVYVTPILLSLFGIVRITNPAVNNTVYTELRRRLGGPGRCAKCGADLGISHLPCPRCGGSVAAPLAFRQPRPVRTAIAFVIALVLQTAYVGSYYHLSRRGMREARTYGMRAFLYTPAADVLENRSLRRKSLSRHYRLAAIYAPLNELDQMLFRADGPVRDLFGLSDDDGASSSRDAGLQ